MKIIACLLALEVSVDSVIGEESFGNIASLQVKVTFKTGKQLAST